MSELQPLTDAAAFDERFAADRPWWLLKHSAICPISTAALGEVTTYLAAHPDEEAAVVVVQDQRELCGHIAQATGRTHQSPQLFLLEGGAVRWHASHWSITAAAMAEAAGSA